MQDCGTNSLSLPAPVVSPESVKGREVIGVTRAQVSPPAMIRAPLLPVRLARKFSTARNLRRYRGSKVFSF